MSSIAVERGGRTRTVGSAEVAPMGPATGVLVRIGHDGTDRATGRGGMSRRQVGLLGTMGPLGIAFLALAAFPHRRFDFGAVMGPEAATMLMLVALTAAVLFLFPNATSTATGKYHWTSQPAQFLGPFDAANALDGTIELVRRQAHGWASPVVVLELSRKGITLSPGRRGAACVRLSWREIQSIDVVRTEPCGIQVTTRSGHRAVLAVEPDRGFEKTLSALGAEIVTVRGLGEQSPVQADAQAASRIAAHVSTAH